MPLKLRCDCNWHFPTRFIRKLFGGCFPGPRSLWLSVLLILFRKANVSVRIKPLSQQSLGHYQPVSMATSVTYKVKLIFHARAAAPDAFHKMDGKIVVTSHPRYGYFYDIKTSSKLVPVIPDLGVSRRSVFDEVKTPAYK